MCTATTLVIAGIYVFACLVGVVGIALTANVFVVVREGLGYPEVRIATGKKVADGWHPGKWGPPGPILIGASVVVGLIGNLIWLFAGS